MKKTAMQELIKGMTDAMGICKGFGASKLELTIFKNCIGAAEDLLKQEKQQIIDAYKNGFYTGCDQPMFDNMPEDYYTQTFNPTQPD